MESKNFKYIPEIDHLRGLAALLVILFHSVHFISYQLRFNAPWSDENWPVASNPLMSLIFEGHTGVSLFFVLSGFIFTAGLLSTNGAAGPIDYRQFLTNRFLRTYPLFLCVLLLGAFALPGSFSWSGFLQSVFFLANLPGALEAGPYTFVFWSIAVEWQFYLIFPALLLFVRQFGVRYLLGLLLLLIVLRALAWLQGADMRHLAYWTLFGRLDQFLVGMLLAVMYVRHFRAGMRADLVFVAGAVAILGLLFAFNQAGGGRIDARAWIVWPTVEAAAWALLIFGYLSAARFLPALLGRALQNLGLISYSLYILHFLVVDLIVRHNVALDWLGGGYMVTALLTSLVVVIPVVILLSLLTYNLIEKPFLALRRRYRSVSDELQK